MKMYIARVRECLLDDDSRQTSDEHLLQEAINMPFKRFAGRFRPAAVATKKIIEWSEQHTWRLAIEDTENTEKEE